MAAGKGAHQLEIFVGDEQRLAREPGSQRLDQLGRQVREIGEVSLRTLLATRTERRSSWSHKHARHRRHRRHRRSGDGAVEICIAPPRLTSLSFT